MSTFFFVDNSFFISQEKTYDKFLETLKQSYNIISNLFIAFGLILKHDKSEIFHFLRARNNQNSLLDLIYIGSPILYTKETWRYLGFYFNKKLTFHQYIQYYTNKALYTMKALNILDNLSRRLLLL